MKDPRYFQHDSNARHDVKIIALIERLGFEGYGRYWAIIEMLRDSDSYEMDTSKTFAIAALRNELKISTDDEVIEFIATLTEFELLQNNNGIVSSNALNKRMRALDELRQLRRENGKKGGRPKNHHLTNGYPEVNHHLTNGYPEVNHHLTNGYLPETITKPMVIEEKPMVIEEKPMVIEEKPLPNQWLLENNHRLTSANHIPTYLSTNLLTNLPTQEVVGEVSENSGKKEDNHDAKYFRTVMQLAQENLTPSLRQKMGFLDVFAEWVKHKEQQGEHVKTELVPKFIEYLDGLPDPVQCIRFSLANGYKRVCVPSHLKDQIKKPPPVLSTFRNLRIGERYKLNGGNGDTFTKTTDTTAVNANLKSIQMENIDVVVSLMQ